MKVCIYFCVLGNNPDMQCLFTDGELLIGLGNSQTDGTQFINETHIGSVVELGILDSNMGFADNKRAWLFDNTQATSEGVVAVFIEV